MMHFSTSLFAILSLTNVASATAVNVYPVHDSTVTYNARLCSGSIPCASITKGLLSTLSTFDLDGNQDRVLVKFELPVEPSTIISCSLNVPAPITTNVGSYALSVSATDNNWVESTVSGISKSRNGTDVGSAIIGSKQQWPKPVQITSACQKNADNNTLSLFVISDGQQVIFNSRESGNVDTFSLHVIY